MSNNGDEPTINIISFHEMNKFWIHFPILRLFDPNLQNASWPSVGGHTYEDIVCTGRRGYILFQCIIWYDSSHLLSSATTRWNGYHNECQHAYVVDHKIQERRRLSLMKTEEDEISRNQIFTTRRTALTCCYLMMLMIAVHSDIIWSKYQYMSSEREWMSEWISSNIHVTFSSQTFL